LSAFAWVGVRGCVCVGAWVRTLAWFGSTRGGRLDPVAQLVPAHLFDKIPQYFVHAGLVFTPLTWPFLFEWGEDWYHQGPRKLIERAISGRQVVTRGAPPMFLFGEREVFMLHWLVVLDQVHVCVPRVPTCVPTCVSHVCVHACGHMFARPHAPTPTQVSLCVAVGRVALRGALGVWVFTIIWLVHCYLAGSLLFGGLHNMVVV
jgi:hypothetical protein